MALALTINGTIKNIVKELAKLSSLEQEEVLAQLRAARLARKPAKSFAKPAKGIKPLSLEEIDRIKHEVRKKYAGK